MNFLEAMMEASRDDHDRPKLTDEQQIARLNEWLGQMSEQHKFNDGDLVQLKPASRKGTRIGANPCIFVRYLPEQIDPLRLCSDPKELTSASVAQPPYNCVIAMIDGDEEVQLWLQSSKVLQPYKALNV